MSSRQDVRLSVRLFFNFVTKGEKWGHSCPISTFLVFIFFLNTMIITYYNILRFSFLFFSFLVLSIYHNEKIMIVVLSLDGNKYFEIDKENGNIVVARSLAEVNATYLVLSKHVTDKQGSRADILINVTLVRPVITAKACPKM